VNEASQRTDLQLTKHYTKIVSKDFKDYVAIVGEGLLAHEFLQKVMLEVAQELVFHKKNLQLHSVESNETGVGHAASSHRSGRQQGPARSAKGSGFFLPRWQSATRVL
jgi:hypothetical protein